MPEALGPRPEGDSITAELGAKLTAQCVFSNGVCPQTCPNYALSLAETERFGFEFMQRESRTRTLWLDFHDSRIEPLQIARALVACEKEPQRPRR